MKSNNQFSMDLYSKGCPQIIVLVPIWLFPIAHHKGMDNGEAAILEISQPPFKLSMLDPTRKYDTNPT